MKQLIVDIDGNHAIVIRFPGGFNAPYNRVATAIKNAAKHVARNPDSFDAKQPIVITAKAAAQLAAE